MKNLKKNDPRKDSGKSRRRIKEPEGGITERKQEEKLAKEKEKFQTYLDIAGVMILVANADETVSLINKKGCEILGYQEEEIIGRNVFDTFVPERMRDEVRGVFKQLIAGNIEPVEYYENPWLTRSGEERLFSWHNEIIKDEEGNITGTLSSAEDITERKKVEESLRESEVRFRGIFESKMMGMLFWDVNDDIADANDVYLEIVGYTRDDLLSGTLRQRDITPPEFTHLDDKALEEVAATGVCTPFEKEYIRKDGSRIPILIGAAFLPGSTIRGVAFVVDNTEKKLAEEELKAINQQLEASNQQLRATEQQLRASNQQLEASNQQLRATEEELRTHKENLEELVEERTVELKKIQERFSRLYHSSKDAIRWADPDGTLVDVNDSYCRLTGYSKEELLAGMKYQEFTPEEYHQWEANLVGNVLKTGEPAEYEKEYIRKDGSRVPTQLTVFVVKGADAEHIGVAAIIKDITERKDMHERLMRHEKLALLGQLAGGVGHELRNPLGAIKNAAYFLNMAVEEPEPEVKETLEILENEVATSERIISSLLGFARPKPPALRKVDVNDTVQVALSRAAVPENVEVVGKLGESLPVVLADPDQLGPVLDNLILNAIQAMPEGGRLTVGSETPDPKWVTVSVTDTGAGIPEENLEKLFEPLFTTKAKGIGLGLPVARTLIEGHRGTIEVESKAGKGSTFTVRLPVGGGEEK